jgi:hypothetical protein
VSQKFHQLRVLHVIEEAFDVGFYNMVDLLRLDGLT